MRASLAVPIRLAAALALGLPVLAALAPRTAHALEPRGGAEVYEQVCRACHETGAGGAPKFGDAKAWRPLIAEGPSSLFRAATKGIRGMPAKGGRPDLAEVEVRRAVVYMANAAGAKWSEPKP